MIVVIKKIINKKWTFLVFALIHYLLSFFMTLNFAKIDSNDFRKKVVFVFVEIMFFFFLIFIYKKLFEIFKDKRKLKNSLKYIKTFLIYFGILFLVLLCVWPGVWRGDDVFIADAARNYDLLGWYSVLSSLFCIFSYKIIPDYVGVIIVQCAFISLIVSYCINKTYEFLNFKSNNYKFILYIPFLLFPVIDNNLYPWRCTWCAYLILLSLVKIVEFYKKNKLEWKNCLEISVLFGILAALRNEQIYFLVILIAISFYFFLRKKMKFVQFFSTTVLAIILTLTVYSLNTLYIGKESMEKYDVSGTIASLKTLVKEAYSDNKEELLEDLETIINVDLLLQEDVSIMESELFWMGLIKEEELGKDNGRYLKAVIKLNLTYPYLAISSRFDGIKNAYKWTGLNLYDSSTIYDQNNTLFEEYNDEIFSILRKNAKPLNNSIRKRTIRFLEGLTLNDYNKHTIIYKMWYIHIPIIVSLIFILYLLIKKKWFYGLVYSSISFKAVLVFFTQPAFLFTYFFSDYVMGYFALSIMLLIFIKRINEKRNKIM